MLRPKPVLITPEHKCTYQHNTKRSGHRGGKKTAGSRKSSEEKMQSSNMFQYLQIRLGMTRGRRDSLLSSCRGPMTEKEEMFGHSYNEH